MYERDDVDDDYISEDDNSPYKYNFVMSSGIDLTKYQISRLSLADAKFALILDVDKLEKLQSDSLKKLRSDRDDSKKGAFIKDDEFKKMKNQHGIL